jgi:hypothetical protein
VLETFALTADAKDTRPTRFLIDHQRYPGFAPLTTDLAKAKLWSERTGPLKFLRLHPHLRKGVPDQVTPFRPVPVVRPVAARSPKPRPGKAAKRPRRRVRGKTAATIGRSALRRLKTTAGHPAAR